MDDGVSVAERAEQETKAVWDPCAGCGANRRLSNGLCYACMTEPVMVELVELRREKTALGNEIQNLQELLDRQAGGSTSLVRLLQNKVKELQRTVDRQIDEREQMNRKVKRLEAANQRQLSRVKCMSLELRPFQKLRDVDRILTLSESEYLLLVSILVDVVADDQTFETLALHRKVRDLSENEHNHDV